MWEAGAGRGRGGGLYSKRWTRQRQTEKGGCMVPKGLCDLRLIRGDVGWDGMGYDLK